MSAVPQFPAANDPDSQETKEWLDALEAVMEREGPERAHFLLRPVISFPWMWRLPGWATRAALG